MLLDIMEITKALQLFYYHPDVIPCLNRSNKTIIQIFIEHKQNQTMHLSGVLLQNSQDKGVRYHFCINHIHRKDHLHHEVINSTETAHAAKSSHMQRSYYLMG